MSTELLQIYVLVYNLQIKEAEIVQFIIKHSVIRMQKDTPPCIHFWGGKKVWTSVTVKQGWIQSMVWKVPTKS